jgi:hypothetical protein
MGQKSRGVGRPSKHTRRVELRLNADDPMTVALEREAEARRVTLQQHITDILTARYLYQPPPLPAPDPPPAATDSASALADEWM